jgi:hypothetical protein
MLPLDGIVRNTDKGRVVSHRKYQQPREAERTRPSYRVIVHVSGIQNRGELKNGRNEFAASWKVSL